VLFFRDRYEKDETFRARVEQSVRRILRLKRRICPGWSLATCTASPDGAGGVGRSRNTVTQIAQSAVTLLYPPSEELASGCHTRPLRRERGDLCRRPPGQRVRPPVCPSIRSIPMPCAIRCCACMGRGGPGKSTQAGSTPLPLSSFSPSWRGCTPALTWLRSSRTPTGSCLRPSVTVQRGRV